MYIAHRINTLEELKNTEAIEFDVRDSNGICIVQHDPFKEGIPLDIFLNEFLLTRVKGQGQGQGQFLIVNIKSEGIEATVFAMLKERGIEDFFMLDCTVPVIYKYTQKGEKRFAVRLSEVEPLEFVRQWKGRVNWVWVDCFSKNILTLPVEQELHSLGFKICVVSPELQGRYEEIEIYAKAFQDSGIEVDAICTKSYNIDKWKKYYFRDIL